MDENRTDKQEEPKFPPPSDAWQEVGRQFQVLGETLGAAFRASWNDEENHKRMQAMQGGLESMVHEVDEGIHKAAETPEAQRARAEVKRAADAVRPHLLTALQDVNEELRKLVSRMEQTGQEPPAQGTSPAEEEPRKEEQQ